MTDEVCGHVAVEEALSGSTSPALFNHQGLGCAKLNKPQEHPRVSLPPDVDQRDLGVSTEAALRGAHVLSSRAHETSQNVGFHGLRPHV